MKEGSKVKTINGINGIVEISSPSGYIIRLDNIGRYHYQLNGKFTRGNYDIYQPFDLIEYKTKKLKLNLP